MNRVIILLAFFGLCTSMSDAQIVNIEDVRSNLTDSISWHEQIELKSNIVKSKERVLTLQGSALIEFQYKKRRFMSLSKYTFVKAGGTDFINQGLQHLRYNSEISKILVYEAFAQVQYNEQTDIRLRGLLGTGLRFRWLNDGKNRFNSGLSYMYEYDDESGTDIVHRDHRLNTYLSGRLQIGKNVDLSTTTYFQPLFDEWSDYRLSSETSISFKVTEKLKFKSSFDITYDSRLPEGVPNTVYGFLNGLSYHFR